MPERFIRGLISVLIWSSKVGAAYIKSEKNPNTIELCHALLLFFALVYHFGNSVLVFSLGTHFFLTCSPWGLNGTDSLSPYLHQLQQWSHSPYLTNQGYYLDQYDTPSIQRELVPGVLLKILEKRCCPSSKVDKLVERKPNTSADRVSHHTEGAYLSLKPT